jgi:hypothetical protein
MGGGGDRECRQRYARSHARTHARTHARRHTPSAPHAVHTAHGTQSARAHLEGEPDVERVAPQLLHRAVVRAAHDGAAHHGRLQQRRRLVLVDVLEHVQAHLRCGCGARVWGVSCAVGHLRVSDVCRARARVCHVCVCGGGGVSWVVVCRLAGCQMPRVWRRPFARTPSPPSEQPPASACNRKHCDGPLPCRACRAHLLIFALDVDHLPAHQPVRARRAPKLHDDAHDALGRHALGVARDVLKRIHQQRVARQDGHVLSIHLGGGRSGSGSSSSSSGRRRRRSSGRQRPVSREPADSHSNVAVWLTTPHDRRPALQHTRTAAHTRSRSAPCGLLAARAGSRHCPWPAGRHG